jgi:hypothetical protein
MVTEHGPDSMHCLVAAIDLVPVQAKEHLSGLCPYEKDDILQQGAFLLR